MIRTITLSIVLLASISASALSVSFDIRPETCGNMNGAIRATPFGGVPPYTISWAGPNGYTAVGDTIFGLEGGGYTCTVTDDVGTMISNPAEVPDSPFLNYGSGGAYGYASEVTGYWGGACVGECNGTMMMLDDWSSGDGPFNYTFDVPTTWIGMDAAMHPVYTGFCLGEVVNYAFVDQNGCTGQGFFTVFGVEESWYPVITDVQGACAGQANGSITFTILNYFPWHVELRLNGNLVAERLSDGSQTQWTITDLAPGTYDLSTDWPTSLCATTAQVVVPDLGVNCGTVQGTMWYDVDADCVLDAGEVGIPQRILNVEPGGYYGITHTDGSYLLNLPTGNYTLEQTGADLIPICPATQPVPITVTTAPQTLDLANGSTTPLDLKLYATSNVARPGFAHQFFARVTNLSPQQSGEVTITCTFDPALTYTSATPAPTSVVGNVITWDLPAFNSFAIQTMRAYLNVPVSTPLGTLLNSTFAVSNTLPESTLINNTVTLVRTVTGSYDPNEKEVLTSSQESRTQYFIGTDEHLDYTIHFQNTGTDTAFTVVVTDTLDAALDMGRFEQGVSSHPCTVDFLPGRVVRWTFNNILLVDSTTNEAGSHGLTSFRIRLHEPVLPGVFITNNADIFFDFNDPIRTPDVSVVTETSTGVNASTQDALMLHPNPSTGNISITGHALVSMNVMDLSGREVFNLQMPPTDVVRCDLSALPAGMYAVRVRTNDGAVNTLRVVLR